MKKNKCKGVIRYKGVDIPDSRHDPSGMAKMFSSEERLTFLKNDEAGKKLSGIKSVQDNFKGYLAATIGAVDRKLSLQIEDLIDSRIKELEEEIDGELSKVDLLVNAIELMGLNPLALDLNKVERRDIFDFCQREYDYFARISFKSFIATGGAWVNAKKDKKIITL